ncbi:MAG: D-glycero-beta-D-manno-heptose-7-phosphate kinase [Deltaproteobacteria bacterium]|nr:D-glycero-beta-D-manno-heptose-7-phosphate kinase [Deltaproteobacteria bacterium]
MTTTFARDELLEHIRKFARRRVLVVGDIMLDRFIWGSVERISPEAPVPVVRVDREESTPGGAANVARNLIALGARADLAGLAGDDAAARTLTDRLAAEGIGELMLAVEHDRPTTVKTRVIAGSQQIVRFDHELARPVTEAARRSLVRDITRRIADYEAVIVSDYNKGVVDVRLMKAIRAAAKAAGIPVVVDPKVRNAPAYSGVDLLTPNHHEAGEMLGVRLANTDAAIEAAGAKLVRKMRLRCLIVTRAALGMSIFREGEGPTHIPTVARQVFDVTGAGDSVIATVTLARAAGASWEQAAAIANFAAGVVVAKVGTGTVSARELKTAIRQG